MSMTRKRSSTNTISKQDSFVIKKRSTPSSGEPNLETLKMPVQKYISFGMDDELPPPRFEINFNNFSDFTPLRLNIGHGSPASLPHLGREDRDIPKASGGFT